MSGFDADNIWRSLLECRVSFGWPVSLLELLKRHPTAKDTYLSEVSVFLLTKRWPCDRYQFPNLGNDYRLKPAMISYLLYGIHLECDDNITQNMPLFTIKRRSLDIIWLVPHRYSNCAAVTEPVELIKMFLDTINWYPKRLYLCDDYDIDDVFEGTDGSDILQLFLSRIEAINLNIEDYADELFAETLEPVWKAGAVSSSLESVSLSACVTNLGGLVSGMQEVLFDKAITRVRDEKEGDILYKFSGLKNIEVLGNDGERHPHWNGHSGFISGSMNSLIPFLDFQVGLETLSFEGLFDIYRVEDENDERYDQYVSDYESSEPFYNYLPYVISKPTFKLLQLKNCHIPVNSIKSMISTFLSRPTDHDLRLEFIDCFVVKCCRETFSEDFPLINQAADVPCVCGQFKSLHFDMIDSELFSLKWLFEYPRLQLNRLELTFVGCNFLHGKAFDSYPSSSSDSLSCRLCHLEFSNTDKNRQALMCNFLRLPFLSEIEISQVYDRDDSTFTVLTEAFMQPFRLTSLKRLRLEQFNARKVNIRSFFDALFSMPKEQLAELTLELIKVRDINPTDIVESWKTNSHGQRLKIFRFVPARGYVYYVAVSISRETFTDIAVTVSCDSFQNY